MRYLPDSIESLSRRIRRRHEAGLWIFNSLSDYLGAAAPPEGAFALWVTRRNS